MSAARPAALFDFDGTLVDSRLGIVRSARYALSRLNETRGGGFDVPEEAALAKIVGPPLRATFADLAGPKNVEEAMVFYRERYAAIGLFESAVFAGVAAALAALAGRGFRLFVATSKNEADARRLLDHFGLIGAFEAVYGATPEGERSDKAALLGYLLEREGLAAEDAIMVGDRKYDALGARAVGLAAVGALWGYGGEAELAAAGAAPLVARPDDLPAAVETLFETRATATPAR